MTILPLPRTWLRCAVFAALILVPSTVFCDEAEMNRLNELGFEDFSAGRFAAAARHFNAAFDAHPEPNLRKNEAVAWFKAGRCNNAISAANAFLIASDTTESDRLEARSIIANCKVDMARSALRAESWALARQLLDEAESLEPDQYARDQIAIARVDLAAHQKREVSKPSIAGWLLVGTGAAIIGGTVVYWALTIPDRKASQTLSPDDPDFDDVSKRASMSRWLVPVALAGGTVMSGLGVYLVVSGGASDEERTEKTALLGMTYRW